MEWSSGVAAGAAGYFMTRGNNAVTNPTLEHVGDGVVMSTAAVLQHIDALVALLNSSVVGQPLDW